MRDPETEFETPEGYGPMQKRPSVFAYLVGALVSVLLAWLFW